MRAAFTALTIAVVAMTLLAGCGQQEIVGADYASKVLSQDDPGGVAIHDVSATRQSDGNVRIQYTFRPPETYESPVAPESITVAGDEVTIIDGEAPQLGRHDFDLVKGKLWIRASYN